ncbi:allantoate amidohydrolase [Planosporangium mesophilum]|uniref:Zn-dependent hydrolase n=1 Tax=Planosporangium mesophilum TaxID=689768 RepID=A0A8J3TJ17_9ACTN|nr:allantoate amidohydrolase [Planosporangium mesophilum]NJC86022.1 allantoate amidohydrolase [Planosporangium mesophilum]GII25529.1 Zn-dependent hydrolase [Planosporangium mesophilum]
MSPEHFAALWRSLLPIGRDGRDGGYLRRSWGPADLECREWFTEEALDRDLTLDPDGNGNLWAWWGDPTAGDAVVTGSHLDSVPHGGAYDGPLGVVSALLAIDLLRERGATPRRPIGITVFTEEEGARFGVACLGSRLLTGAIDPARARALTDRDGLTLADAMTKAGYDPADLGADPARLGRIGAFLELHIEQGRALVGTDAAVGVGSAIWPHGRWRMEFTGEANHAGTTRMADRRDPMLTFAYAVLAADEEARRLGAHATVGRVEATPNATNAIPSAVTAWLDARAGDASVLQEMVEALRRRAAERAAADGTGFAVRPESESPVVEFDSGLRDRIASRLGGAPILPTGAGHDAGVLASHVPTAMLFVRNPTGVSHAPAEYATDVDCWAGVTALADALEELAC